MKAPCTLDIVYNLFFVSYSVLICWIQPENIHTTRAGQEAIYFLDIIARTVDRTNMATSRRTVFATLSNDPHFVVLGCQKAGTTAMYAYLCSHPQVISAKRKETHFFDWRFSEACAYRLSPATRKLFERDASSVCDEYENDASIDKDVRYNKACMGATKPGQMFGVKTKRADPKTADRAPRRVDRLAARCSRTTVTTKDKRDDDDTEDVMLLREMRMKYLIMFPVRYLLSVKRSAARRDEERCRLIVTGEATPSYLLYGASVAKRLKAIAGSNTKLIVCVRNPIDRAYSHYQMTVDPVGSEFVKRIRGTYEIGDKTFRDVMNDDRSILKRFQLSVRRKCQHKGDKNEDEKEDDTTYENEPYAPDALARLQREYYDRLPMEHGAHSYVGRGMYAAQLQIWLQYFPRDQVRVVCIDRMKDPEGCRREMRKTYAYLGLPAYELSDELTRPLNTKETRKRTYGPIDSALRAELAAFFKPHNEALYRMCGENFGWES